MIDAATRGSLNNKTPEEAQELIYIMTANNYLTHDKTIVKKIVMELDTLDVILAQNKALSQQVATLIKQISHLQVEAIATPNLV